MKTVYIVPALTDIAGQCNIVLNPSFVANPREDYRANPSAWKTIGIMNSRGKLVCVEADPNVVQELKDCEPLAAGYVLRVNDIPVDCLA